MRDGMIQITGIKRIHLHGTESMAFGVLELQKSSSNVSGADWMSRQVASSSERQPCKSILSFSALWWFICFLNLSASPQHSSSTADALQPVTVPLEVPRTASDDAVRDTWKPLTFRHRFNNSVLLSTLQEVRRIRPPSEALLAEESRSVLMTDFSDPSASTSLQSKSFVLFWLYTLLNVQQSRRTSRSCIWVHSVLRCTWYLELPAWTIQSNTCLPIRVCFTIHSSAFFQAEHSRSSRWASFLQRRRSSSRIL